MRYQGMVSRMHAEASMGSQRALRRLGRGLVAMAMVAAIAGCGVGEGNTKPERTEGDPVSTTESGDDGAVRELVGRYVAAWNAGDGAAFGATYAPEAVHVTFDGTQVNGRTDITQVHTRLFDTFLRDSRITLNITGFHRLTGDVAVVHTSGGILEPRDTQVSADRLSVNTMVASKHANKWLLDAVQVTRVAPPGLPG